MKLKRKSNHQVARIEMLPLIDIVFLVLVVFIYAMLSMVVHKGIPVRLPKASTVETDQKDFTAISLLENGKIFFNKQECTFEQLDLFLLQGFDTQKENPVYINGDRAVSYGQVVQVLDIVRTRGYEKVVIEAEQKQEE